MIKSTNYNKIYVDLDFDLKKNEVTKDVMTRTGLAAVNQSIKNIVLTSIGERPFDDSFGVGVYQTLFELDDPMSIGFLKARIQSQLRIFEPRILCESNDIQIIPGNQVEINIKYKLKTFGNPSQFTTDQEIAIVISGDR